MKLNSSSYIDALDEIAQLLITFALLQEFLSVTYRKKRRETAAVTREWLQKQGSCDS